LALRLPLLYYSPCADTAKPREAPLLQTLTQDTFAGASVVNVVTKPKAKTIKAV